MTEVADGFDARRDARSRRYRYRLDTGAGAEPVRVPPNAALAPPIRRRARRRMRSTPPRGPRLHRVHADRHQHRHFDRTILDAGWSGSPEPPRLRDRGGRLPPRHGPGAVGTILEVAAERRTLADFERLLGGAAAGRLATRWPLRPLPAPGRLPAPQRGRRGTRRIDRVRDADQRRRIAASGLQALRRALLEIDGIELHVIAPDSNRSATARSITTRTPLWVEEVDFGDGTVGYATDGTPVDCVRSPSWA